MEKIIKLLTELEEEIVETNIYKRCPEFNKDCCQCQFWARFDWIKKDLINLKAFIDDDKSSPEEVKR